ncbi:hypothetical protein Tco_0454254 [Tanacetum coccineum]
MSYHHHHFGFHSNDYITQRMSSMSSSQLNWSYGTTNIVPKTTRHPRCTHGCNRVGSLYTTLPVLVRALEFAAMCILSSSFYINMTHFDKAVLHNLKNIFGFSSSALASKAVTVKNKGLIAEAYEWDEEEVSLDDNEMVEVKVLMALAEENDAISKEGAKNVDQLTEDPSSSGQKDLVFVKSLADDIKVSIPGYKDPGMFEDEGFILPNHDTSRILPTESQRNTTNPSVADLTLQRQSMI